METPLPVAARCGRLARMDRHTVLEAFDQLRRSPGADHPVGRVEHDKRVTRYVSPGGGWNGVVWSDLDEATADEVIGEQIVRFDAFCDEWEWKHYSYDRPADLPRRLVAAGLTPQPEEALLVADVTELALDPATPPGVVLRPVVSESEVAELVALHDAVFGVDHTAVGEAIRRGLTRDPSTVAAVIAWAGDTPVGAARVEFHYGTDFASLWGGGTLPDWRGRGVFRSLVAHRAATAAARGFHYLQVDASEDSQPILERLGFAELARTTPFVHTHRPTKPPWQISTDGI
jgi:ribosomal protein S18 acetylase RimI-like enzyme